MVNKQNCKYLKVWTCRIYHQANVLAKIRNRFGCVDIIKVTGKYSRSNFRQRTPMRPYIYAYDGWDKSKIDTNLTRRIGQHVYVQFVRSMNAQTSGKHVYINKLKLCVYHVGE